MLASTHDRVAIGNPFFKGVGSATFFTGFMSLNMRGTNKILQQRKDFKSKHFNTTNMENKKESKAF